MSENEDVLKITIQFNKMKIPYQVTGKSALSIYQKVLEIFMNPHDFEDSEEISSKPEITDYA